MMGKLYGYQTHIVALTNMGYAEPILIWLVSKMFDIQMIHIGLLLGLSHGFPTGKGVSCGSDVHSVAGGIEKSEDSDVWPKK